ncbi:MAG TPA: pentapeptide repeat-containing protein [candidate division Zixibacteria bacterium]|nr:pentapeptide repeat-containing protein [candidate division Zixibacteria bacterium]
MSIKCTYSRHTDSGDIRCRRIIERGQVCILHDNRPDKDQAEFSREIERTIKDPNSENVDFRGVVFVGSYENFTNKLFERGVLFDYAEFVVGVPKFIDVVFKKDISFRETKFNKGVIFNNCEFQTPAIFKYAGFMTAETRFQKTVFHEHADFSGVTFQGRTYFSDSCIFEKAGDFSKSKVKFHLTISQTEFKSELKFDSSIIESSVSFDTVKLRGKNSFLVQELKNNNFNFIKTEFLGPTSFNLFRYGCPAFEYCDLKEVRLLQLINLHLGREYPTAHIERCKWPSKKLLFFPLRTIVADENYSTKSLELLRLYKFLHRKYFESLEYQLSSEFYIGYMIQKRKLQAGEKLAKSIDWFYGVFSRYGESIYRPFFALILMWSFVPALLLYFGVKLEWPNGNETFLAQASFKDYWRAFSLNLQLSTLIRASDLRPHITSIESFILLVETVLNGFFIGFLALGIRRRAVPKKPAD